MYIWKSSGKISFNGKIDKIKIQKIFKSLQIVEHMLQLQRVEDVKY